MSFITNSKQFRSSCGDTYISKEAIEMHMTSSNIPLKGRLVEYIFRQAKNNYFNVETKMLSAERDAFIDFCTPKTLRELIFQINDQSQYIPNIIPFKTLFILDKILLYKFIIKNNPFTMFLDISYLIHELFLYIKQNPQDSLVGSMICTHVKACKDELNPNTLALIADLKITNCLPHTIINYLDFLSEHDLMMSRHNGFHIPYKALPDDSQNLHNDRPRVIRAKKLPANKYSNFPSEELFPNSNNGKISEQNLPLPRSLHGNSTPPYIQKTSHVWHSHRETGQVNNTAPPMQPFLNKWQYSGPSQQLTPMPSPSHLSQNNISQGFRPSNWHFSGPPQQPGHQLPTLMTSQPLSNLKRSPETLSTRPPKKTKN